MEMSMRSAWERMTRTRASVARSEGKTRVLIGTTFYVPLASRQSVKARLDRNYGGQARPVTKPVRACLRAPIATRATLATALATARLAGLDANAVHLVTDAFGNRRVLLAPHVERIARAAVAPKAPKVNAHSRADIGKREAARLARIDAQWRAELERRKRLQAARITGTIGFGG